MRKNDWFPSKYLKPPEFAEPRVLKFDAMQRHEFTFDGKTKKLPVAFFSDPTTKKKISQGLVVSWTLYDAMAEAFGEEDSDLWPGLLCELYQTDPATSYQGKAQIGVRAAPPAPPASANSTPPFTDEIPFG